MEFYKVEFTYVYFVECRAFKKKKIYVFLLENESPQFLVLAPHFC